MQISPKLPLTKPDLNGLHGKAWRLDLDAIAAKSVRGAALRLSSVCVWVAFAPYAHPFWHSYGIYCVNLREIPGVEKPIINLKNATHEIMVFALDPDHQLIVDDSPRLLMPANFAAQFIEPSDEAAADRIALTVQDVIDGRLNPDTDYIRWWMHRFGSSNVKDPDTAGDTRIVMDRGDGSAPIETVIKAQPGPQDMH